MTVAANEAAAAAGTADALPPLLTGMRVIEHAVGAAAPYAGRILAELGADVVKVEPPGGDPARRSDSGATGFSGLFEHVNAGKRSLVLDTARLSGRTALRALLAGAQCVLLDESSGVLSDPELYGAIPTTAAVISITPFGRGNAASARRAGAYGLFHASGEGITTPEGGDLSRPPVAPTANVALLDAGVIGAFSVLAFALHGDLHGPVDDEVTRLLVISMRVVLMALGRQNLAAFPNEGRRDTRALKHGPLVTLVLRCADGEIISPLGEHQWSAWCGLAVRPDLERDPRFASQVLRSQHVPELARELEGWTMTFTRAELELLTQPMGIPLAGVLNPRDVLDNAQLRFRGFFAEAAGTQARPRTASALPFCTQDGRRWRISGAAPALGADTAPLLAAAGLDEEFIRGGRNARAIA
jgi:CoA:oxalate CoA-transferase